MIIAQQSYARARLIGNPSEKRCGIGNKFIFLKTTIGFALCRKDVGSGLPSYIKEITDHW